MSCTTHEAIPNTQDVMYRETLMRAVNCVLNELLRSSDSQKWEPPAVDDSRKALTAKVVALLRADAKLLLGL